MHTHERHQLLWDFSKSLFCKFGWARGIFVERNELDDITSCDNSILISKSSFITVESIHVLELWTRANTNDNDTKRKRIGSLNNLLNGSSHIIDTAISNNKKDEILLLLGILRVHPNDFRSLMNDVGKVCWTREANVLNSHMVSIKNTTNSWYLWVAWITVEGKAVAHLAIRHLTTITINRNHTITII